MALRASDVNTRAEIEAERLGLPPFVPWEGHGGLRAAILSRHTQGEHVSIFGPTGLGKTTVALDVVQGFHDLGGACIILTNKKKDEGITKFIAANPRDWSRIKDWPPQYGDRVKNGLVLWPDYPGMSPAGRRRVAQIFHKALNDLMHQGAWYVYLDEANYLVEQLKLKTDLDEMWQQSRSNDLSIIAGAQRPVWISKGMTTQQKWVLAFRPDEAEEGQAVGKSLGSSQRWAPILEKVPFRKFICYYSPQRKYYLSTIRSTTGVDST